MRVACAAIGLGTSGNWSAPKPPGVYARFQRFLSESEKLLETRYRVLSCFRRRFLDQAPLEFGRLTCDVACGTNRQDILLLHALAPFLMPQDLLAFSCWPGVRHCHNKHNNMPSSTSCDWKARDCVRAELWFVGALFSVLPTGLPRVHRRCVSINCAKFHSSQLGSVRVRFPRIAGSFSSVTATAPPTWRLAYWAFGVLERYEWTSQGTRESSLDSLLECMKAPIFSQTSSRFRSPSYTGLEEWIWPDYIPLKWMARFRLLFSPCPTISSGIWI